MVKKVTNSIQNNIFNLTDSDNFTCKLKMYTWSLTSLEIICSNKKVAWAIGFIGTEYFSGAIRWTGANFRLHPHVDCIDLLHKHYPQYERVTKKYQDKNGMHQYPFKYYSVESNEGEVIHIIAASASIEKFIP